LLVKWTRRLIQAGAPPKRWSAFSEASIAVLALGLGLSPLMAGCASAPTIALAGAYFPAWLLCAIFAVFVALVTHTFMTVIKLSDRIPFEAAVCASLGVIAALALWRLWEQ
jgi:YtcA family